MQPRTVTLSSSGSSPWQLLDWYANPFRVGIEVTQSSALASWQVDITMQDPTGIQSSGTLTVFQASQAGAISLSGSSLSAMGYIDQPITAWRLTLNNSSLGAISATYIQPGGGR